MVSLILTYFDGNSTVDNVAMMKSLLLIFGILLA
jgi:hypothetical protein